MWGTEYPNHVPEISLETFYNRHLLTSVKDLIVEELLTQANDLVGMSMTYSLFELAEEKGEMWLQRQPEVAIQVESQKQEVSQPQQQGQLKTNRKRKTDLITNQHVYVLKRLFSQV